MLNRSIPHPLFLVAAAAFALAACDQAPDPAGTEVAVPPSTTTAPEAGAGMEAGTGMGDTDAIDAVDATRVVDRAPVADAGPDFDVRAFAGRFAADGTRLDLGTDGSYALLVHAGSADADLARTGTWTVEADGARIRLDPDRKDEADRVFTIASHRELVEDPAGVALHRAGD